MFVACRFVALASLLIASAASAAEPEPSERDRNIARESVYQGDDFTKRGDFKRALEAYRRANDIMQVPTTAIEVVRVEQPLDWQRRRHAEAPAAGNARGAEALAVSDAAAT